ncbi:response regulator transcription factor [Eubacterium sp. AB3007]|uniref:response regulator transcription factor n=1 Tax=Eubacterium sp. AB3007 TaxID=1392487 RepID=UPI00048A273A|nr:response regulator transcription factor [Eubacterium sp. AB3007]
MKARILVTEDDGDIREGVRILLESEGYEVLEAESGEQCLSLIDEALDLVILDVMMPGMNGIRTCEEIRKSSNVPVLFLTAKDQESDKLLGLMVGGDDYLSKPFSYSELLGRVKAQIRRFHVYKGKDAENVAAEDACIERAGVRLRKDCNRVWVDGGEVMLSDIEYRILMLLISHPEMVFSAKHIYESVWEEPFFHSSASTVMVHIRKLRLKIEKNPQEPVLIKTIWGKGYRFG